MLLGGSCLFREQAPNGKTLDFGDFVLIGDTGILTPIYSPFASATRQRFLVYDLLVLPCYRDSTTGLIPHGQGPSKAVSLKSLLFTSWTSQIFPYSDEKSGQHKPPSLAPVKDEMRLDLA